MDEKPTEVGIKKQQKRAEKMKKETRIEIRKNRNMVDLNLSTLGIT